MEAINRVFWFKAATDICYSTGHRN